MRNISRVLVGAAALFTAEAQAQAPEPPQPRLRRQRQAVVEEVREIRRTGPGGPGDHTVRFAWSAEAFEGKEPVKNAPYSASAVTELEQTLGDGNRIRQKTTSQLARDREGRTRRELALSVVGPLAVGAETPRMVFLQDPVAGTSYTLDPERKVARKMPSPTVHVLGSPAADGADSKGKRIQRIERIDDSHFELPVPGPGPEMALGPPAPVPLVLPHPIGAIGVTRRLPPAKTEDLGSQVMEGVRVQGTRSTVTIPAGEVGNERPLSTVSERWFSPELGVVVMSRHSDPRLGTTTYRLTDLRRGDPEPALFQVPAGYTVKDEPARTMLLRRRLHESPATGEATGPAAPAR
jgi:hypothetical protein